MTEERAVLAGGCFWGMQDLIRGYDGVLSTRVGYTGGSVPHATYRNHGSHAEAVEIIFDPARVSYRQILELSSRCTTQVHAIARATTSGPAIDLRSSIPVTSRSGLPKTPSPTSMHRGCGRARSLRKSFRQATSGRPNPSIRTISNDIPTATPAISSGPTGDCRFAPTRFHSRRNLGGAEQARARDLAISGGQLVGRGRGSSFCTPSWLSDSTIP